MKNIFRLAYLIFLISILFACQSEQETRKGETKDVRLISKGKIHIPLDSITAVPYVNTQLFQENKLIVLNSKINALQFYEFKDGGKMTKRIKFEKEGDKGVGSITKFLVHSTDSIFLLNAYQYRLYLVNGQGDILEKYSLLNKKIGDDTAMPDPFPFSRIILLEDYLYICSIPDDNPSTDAFYLSKNSVTRLDLKRKKYDYIYGFPEIYKKNRYPNSLSQICMDFIPTINKFIYSFAASENVQVTDINHRQTKEYYAGSILFDKIKPLTKPITDEVENNLEGNKRAKFVKLLYDPYRNFIIRTTCTSAINEDNRQQTQKASLIFLDYQFKKMGEVITKEDVFLLNIHITKEGIYIFKKPDNENEMVYELFEVSVK
ncbi:MAG: DUF4221 family protein [Saprospiraceae bacterium]|nr:DUF4221 family protein [Saprospiraceae bacterium]